MKATVAGQATFRAAKNRNGVRFIPTSTGKPRTVSASGIQGYLDIFNRTGSLRTTDYSDTRRQHYYLLAVIQLWEMGVQLADTGREREPPNFPKSRGGAGEEKFAVGKQLLSGG